MTLMEATRSILWWGDHAALAYFLTLNTCYAVLLALSIPELWRHWRLAADEHLQRLLASEALPPLSLLVPAYNEEVTITSSLLSFLTLEYPQLEVVVVNDGSTDRTIDVLVREFDLYEVPPAFPVVVATKPVRAYYRSRRHARVLVIDKANGGKADSLNAAMNAARHPFVVAVDADTVIEPDALVRLARPFLLGTNVAAVGGTIRVVNNCTVELGRVTDARVDARWLPGCQVVEYLRAFLFGRLGWNRLGGNLIISGAFGLFRKEYLRAIGGYRTGNVTEDMDLVVRLHRYLCENGIKAELPFIPDPVAWTEVPVTASVLGRQRERWHRGLIGTLWEHRVMLFNPRYGRIGMLSMPFYLFGELLAPVVELIGWVTLVLGLAVGAVNGSFALLFLAVAIGYGMLLSCSRSSASAGTSAARTSRACSSSRSSRGSATGR
jgi:cellulose synthase/poly-beta-1,6-N-acetylglucosamine synthase-like glycosyltransferase